MSEQPIERLNYYDGQRLQASDFRLEQSYHMRIQRWLSKSLFYAGVADGLEVSIDRDPHYVIVTPGLALDDLGRAVILVNAKRLQVQAPYLCVRYAEQPTTPQSDSCGVRDAETQQQLDWGGPSRVVSEPEFIWRRDYPIHDEREIVIAKLGMQDPCVAQSVLEGPRRIAVATQVSRVQSCALEGEKDIDAANPKRIYFHVIGRKPNAVYLVLRGSAFSGLHYTELPRHTHSPPDDAGATTLRTGTPGNVDSHVHSGTTLTLLDGLKKHTHRVKCDVHMVWFGQTYTCGLYVGQWGSPVIPDVILEDLLGQKDANGQDYYWSGFKFAVLAANTIPEYPIKGQVGAPVGSPYDAHTHPITMPEIGNAAGGPSAPQWTLREGPQYTYLTNLHVFIDGTAVSQDFTDKILAQIKLAWPDIWDSQTRIGNRAQGKDDPFVREGTRLIRLDVLEGVDFSTGEHFIELQVHENGTGGCVHYNLYVE
jgi:hypothetical protein